MSLFYLARILSSVCVCVVLCLCVYGMCGRVDVVGYVCLCCLLWYLCLCVWYVTISVRWVCVHVRARLQESVFFLPRGLWGFELLLS